VADGVVEAAAVEEESESLMIWCTIDERILVEFMRLWPFFFF